MVNIYRRKLDLTGDVVRAWHTRYINGATCDEIGKSLKPPVSAGTIYYWFDKFELPRSHMRGHTLTENATREQRERRRAEAGPAGDVVAEASRSSGVPRRPMCAPPIYRSEFIQGVDPKRLVAGR